MSAPDDHDRRIGIASIAAGAGYTISLLLPYRGDQAMSSIGSIVTVALVIPAAVAVICGFMGLAGNRHANEVGIGAATGLAALTTFLLVLTGVGLNLSTDGVSPFQPGFGPGYYGFILCIGISLIGLAMALTAHHEHSIREQANPPIAVLGALAAAGVPLCMFIPQGQLSPWDFAHGGHRAAMLLIALVPVSSAIAVVATRSKIAVAMAGGIASTYAAIAIALLVQSSGLSDGSAFFLYDISHPGPYKAVVIGMCVLYLLALIVPANTAPTYSSAATVSTSGPPAAPTSNAAGSYTNTKLCPWCAETIKAAAVLCRYCGKDIPNPVDPSPPGVEPHVETPVVTEPEPEPKPESEPMPQPEPEPVADATLAVRSVANTDPPEHVTSVVREVGVRPTQAPPPQWGPDPFHRYETRYWDGAQWTAAVATGGVAAVDEPGNRPA